MCSILWQRGNTGGFTLLELLMVMVIIGLMSTFVVPKLTGPLGNLDLKTASQKISASLRYARSQATSEKATYVAQFDFDKNNLVVIDPPVASSGKEDLANKPETPGKTPGEPSDSEQGLSGGRKTYNLPGGVKLVKGVSRDGDVNAGLFRILFFPSGGSSGGEITVANERGRQYRIHVDFVTGMVQLTEVAG